MTRPTGDDVIYAELSHKIMEIVFEVHDKLGPGFGEDIYETATVMDLELAGIPVQQQKTFNVVYRDKVIGTYRADLIVDDKIILELKAVTALNDLFKQQLLSYLKASNHRLGFLINFGDKRVESVRIDD
jgi:GxxExxY protein